MLICIIVSCVLVCVCVCVYVCMYILVHIYNYTIYIYIQTTPTNSLQNSRKGSSATASPPATALLHTCFHVRYLFPRLLRTFIRDICHTHNILCNTDNIIYFTRKMVYYLRYNKYYTLTIYYFAPALWYVSMHASYCMFCCCLIRCFI